jgi:NAD(P)-dependent dehydrogenase (short-subunit alcohol dehydrogenase family)
VDDLYAFVLSEIGRAASEQFADSNALVLFCASPEGAKEIAAAIQEAMPGLVEKKWPR